MDSNHTADIERIVVLVRHYDGQTYEEILNVGRVTDVITTSPLYNCLFYVCTHESY
jgi:hypothetical protein